MDHKAESDLIAELLRQKPRFASCGRRCVMDESTDPYGQLEEMRERIASGNCGEDDAWIVDEVAAWRERFPDLSVPINHVTTDGSFVMNTATVTPEEVEWLRAQLHGPDMKCRQCDLTRRALDADLEAAWDEGWEAGGAFGGGTSQDANPYRDADD